MSKAAPMSLPPRIPAKGGASPSVASIEAPPAVVTPSAGEARPLPPNVKAMGGTVAVTVRMDVETYVRMKTHGAQTRQTNQAIILDMIKAQFGADAQ